MAAGLKGMFVNRDVESKDDINILESKSTTSLARENKSLTVYSLVVIGSKWGQRTNLL